MPEVYEVYDPITGEIIEIEGMVILDRDDFYLEADNNNMPDYTQEQAIAAAESLYL